MDTPESPDAEAPASVPAAEPAAEDAVRDQAAEAIAAQVVVWHNRHPLARRIVAAQVKSIGVVALPFFANAGSNTSDPPREQLRRGFREALLAPTSAARLARWARRHGTTTRPGDATWPQRDAEVVRALAPASSGGEPVWLHVAVAAIEDGARRLRVAIDAGAKKPAVLGRRSLSPPRVAAAGAGAFVLVAAIATVVSRTPASESIAGTSTAASAPITAASAARVSLASSEAEPVASAVAHSASAAASATAPDAESEAASEPATGAPTAGADHEPPPDAAPGAIASIRPVLSPFAREAAISEALRLRGVGAPRSAAASAAPPSNAASIALLAPRPDDALPPIAPGSKLYALVTRPTRGRGDSEALLNQLRGAAANVAPPFGARKELMQVAGAWRAAWWPFLKRADAERARNALGARGLTVELIEF